MITFGVGIAVGAAIFGHHDWGWHAWGMNWGAPRPEGPGWHGGWQRPAVVYNHTTYVSKSTTVINNITNIRNTRITNNYGGNVTNNTTNTTIERNTMQPGAEPMRGQAMEQHPGAVPMTMPHFGANDARPGARPSPDAFAQNRANELHAEAPGQHASGAMREERPHAMKQEHTAQENRAATQQQQQQQQQRDTVQQQQHNAAEQQQREALQQHNAEQQRQREAMQQRNETPQQVHKEAPPHNEAQPREHAAPQSHQPAPEHAPAQHPHPAESHPPHETHEHRTE